MKKGFPMSNLQTNYSLKLGFQNVDYHIGGTWLINGIKQRKYNQLLSMGNCRIYMHIRIICPREWAKGHPPFWTQRPVMVMIAMNCGFS